MATTTPSPPPTPTPTSPPDQVENTDQQPVISSSPPSHSLPIEHVEHHHYQQFAKSNSTYSPPRTSVAPPENPVDSQQQTPSEDVEDEEETPVPPSPPLQENILDRRQPLAPPSPSSILPPPLTEVEHPPESTGPDHESPHLKQSPPIGPEDPVGSPNYHKSPNPNPNSDHESPSPSSPTTLEGNPSPKAQQSPENPSPSPPPTALSPSSPPAPPLGVPLLLQTVATSSPSKPQASPWTHQETANLIQAYQEKWYSLKKGPLKAGQWEEVAITVAARCGYDEPTKTAKQCRHKIEKLRKRYRAERGKPRSKATAWNFFKLMDNLEKGPLPISSSQPAALVVYQKPSNSNGKKRKNDESDDEFLVNKRNTRSTSSDHQIVNGSLARNLRFSDERVMRRLRTPVFHKNKGYYQEEEEEKEEDEDGDDEDEGEGVAAQLAAEIKGFAQEFVKMENKKIEMIKDVERYRLEMENKRMEMILESQQMLVETVNKAFSSSHKTHKLSAK